MGLSFRVDGEIKKDCQNLCWPDHELFLPGSAARDVAQRNVTTRIEAAEEAVQMGNASSMRDVSTGAVDRGGWPDVNEALAPKAKWRHHRGAFKRWRRQLGPGAFASPWTSGYSPITSISRPEGGRTRLAGAFFGVAARCWPEQPKNGLLPFCYPIR